MRCAPCDSKSQTAAALSHNNAHPQLDSAPRWVPRRQHVSSYTSAIRTVQNFSSAGAIDCAHCILCSRQAASELIWNLRCMTDAGLVRCRVGRMSGRLCVGCTLQLVLVVVSDFFHSWYHCGFPSNEYVVAQHNRYGRLIASRVVSQHGSSLLRFSSQNAPSTEHMRWFWVISSLTIAYS